MRIISILTVLLSLVFIGCSNKMSYKSGKKSEEKAAIETSQDPKEQPKVKTSSTGTGDSSDRDPSNDANTGDSSHRDTEGDTNSGDSDNRGNEGDTNSGDSDNRGNEGNPNSGDSGNRGNEGNPNSGDSGDRDTSTDNVDINESSINCDDKDQVILILDFKSGWWSGDGGEVYRKITSVIKDGACTTEVNVEYHHILAKKTFAVYNGVQFNAPKTKSIIENLKHPLEQYTQVWVLSGSADDPADMRIDHPYFIELRNKLLTAKANMFIGSGQGSITHANEILKAPQDPTNGFSDNIVEAVQPEGNLFFPEIGIKVLSRINPQDGAHGLFTGVSNLMDTIDNSLGGGPLGGIININNGGSKAMSDKIIDESITIIAKSSEDHPCIGIIAKGAKKILVDSGMQRLYGANMPDEPASLKYLTNIVSYLSK